MKKLLSRQRAFGLALGLVAGWWAAGTMTSSAMAASAVQGTWKVTCTPDADTKGAKEQKVTLVFKPAEFSVTEWAKAGYKPAAYETDERRFGPAKFDATIENPKDGSKAKWSGVADSGQIKGDLVITKKNGDEAKYSFQGERTSK